MKNKQVFYWFLDLVIIVVFLVEYSMKLTGYQWHELLGLAVGALLIVHALVHWQWIVSVTKRLVNSLKGKAVLCYTIDFVLLALITGIILTGLLISSLLNLPLAAYDFWRFLHVSISYLTLVFVGVKIALHWSWIVNTARRKIFRRGNTPMPEAANATACMDQALVNRRQFLQESGIFTGVLLFAGLGYGKWILENLFQESEQGTTTVQTNAEGIQPTATPFQPLATETSAVEGVEPAVESASDTQAAATVPSVPTSVPTAVPTVQEVAPVTTSVRCTRACSYPGRCRRYTDSNNNNRCDLSEW